MYKTKEAKKENANLIMTGAEYNAAVMTGIRREIKGTDFRNHGGARGQIHASKKDYARFGRKEKNRTLRDE